MAKAKQEALHPEVVALAAALVPTRAQLSFADDVLFEHYARLARHDRALREKIAADLLVVAGRLRRQAPDRSNPALAQLLALCTLLLGSSRRAQQMFRSAGVDISEARKLLSQKTLAFEDKSKIKPGQASASLLSILKGNK